MESERFSMLKQADNYKLLVAELKTEVIIIYLITSLELRPEKFGSRFKEAGFSRQLLARVIIIIY